MIQQQRKKKQERDTFLLPSKPIFMNCLWFYLLLFLFVCLFNLERGRVWGAGVEEEGKKESQAGSELGMEPHGARSHNPEIMT